MSRESAAAVKERDPDAPPKMDNPANIATPPLPGDPTLAERRRNEDKRAKERDEVHDEYKSVLSKLDLSGSKYKFLLYRTAPLSHKGVKTGSQNGMLISTYNEAPDIIDIMEEHGGQDYYISIKGPNPEDPNGREMTKKAKLNPISGPPKTVSTANGTMLLDDAPASAKTDDGAMHTLLGIIKDEFAKKNEPTRVAGPDPMIQMQMQQSKEAHEMRLKQMDLDAARAKADADIETARLKAEAEKAKIEADARIKAAELQATRDEKERDRAHTAEMARVKADSEARIAASEAAAKVQIAAAEQRAADQKALRDMLDTLTKNSDAKMEKIVDKLSSNKPVSAVKEVAEALDSFRKMGIIPSGEKAEEEEGPTAKLISQAMPEFFKLANKALERLDGSGGEKKEKKQLPEAKTDVVAAAEIPPEARDVTPGAAGQPAAPAAPPEPELPFDWPVEGDDDMKLGAKMGKNLGIAIEAKWDARRVFNDMVAVFPPGFHKALVGWGLDMVFRGISEHAPPEAAIRSVAGRQIVRTVFKALEKKVALGK